MGNESNDTTNKPEASERRPSFSGLIPISAIARGRRFNVSLEEKIRRMKRRERLGWR